LLFLLRIASVIDKIGALFLKISSWLCLILVLLTAEQVLARYLFNESSIAMQELEWHLFGAIFLLAAANTFCVDQHVRVDIFQSRFSPKVKSIVEITCILFLLLPVCYALIFYGINFVEMALSFSSMSESPDAGFLDKYILIGERSPDPGGLPARWIMRSVIPLSGAMLLLQGCSQIIKNVSIFWRGNGA